MKFNSRRRLQKKVYAIIDCFDSERSRYRSSAVISVGLLGMLSAFLNVPKCYLKVLHIASHKVLHIAFTDSEQVIIQWSLWH